MQDMTAIKCRCAKAEVENYRKKNYIQIDTIINLSTFCQKFFHMPIFVEQMLVQIFEHRVFTLTLILSFQR